MRKATLIINYSYDITCPYCENYFDLNSGYDYEGVISKPIFNNEWDKLKGFEVECHNCGKIFKIGDIES